MRCLITRSAAASIATSGNIYVPSTGSTNRPKRPRGRPPVGAVLADNGTVVLPPAAIEAAAERVIKHRTACRERYVATRKGLRMAKPELFAKRQWSANQQLSSLSKKENDERQGATGTMG